MDKDRVLKSCRDKEAYPAVFTITDGIGIRTEKTESRGEMVSVKSWEGKRKVCLDITTWRGTSMNAIHYYGKITIDGVNMQYVNEPNVMGSCDIKKYGALCAYQYKTELLHELTAEEIEDDPERWSDYDAGSFTNGFESLEDLIETFKEVAKVRFCGEGWEFLVDIYNSSKPRTLSEFEDYINPKPKTSESEPNCLLMKDNGEEMNLNIDFEQLENQQITLQIVGLLGAVIPISFIKLKNDDILFISNLEDGDADNNDAATAVLRESGILRTEIFGNALLVKNYPAKVMADYLLQL